MADQRVICVLGMHRSGTSLVSRLLNLAGVYLGPEEHLMPAAENNPSGFWEHQEISDINEEIFNRLGGSWHEPPEFAQGWESSRPLAGLRKRARAIIRDDFGEHELWGWKDPRACLTLPFWRLLLPPMRYVVCFRNPIDVAASIERSYGLERGLDLWLTYVRTSLTHSSGAERLLVSYDEAMADPGAALARLAAFAGRPEAAKRPKVRAAVDEFVEAGLWHHRSSLGDLADDDALPFPTKALFVALCGALATDSASEVAFDALLEPFARAAADLQDAQRRDADELARAERRAGEAERALAGVRSDLDAREGVLAKRERALARVQAELSRHVAALSRRDGELAQRDEALAERNAQLEEQTHAGAGLREALDAERAASAEKDAELAVLRNELAGVRSDLDAREGVLAKRERALARVQAELSRHVAALSRRDGELAQRDEALAERNAQLEEQTHAGAGLREALDAERAASAEKNAELAALRDELVEGLRELETAGADAGRARKELAAQHGRVRELEATVAEAEREALRRERELTELRAEIAVKEAELAAQRERLRPEPARRIAAARSARRGSGAPSCSIVIPVFNKASLTRACLEALLATPRPRTSFEIVVANDASTDTTADVLARYGDTIRVVTHEVNTGFAATCNLGAGAASGDYLIFLNNDTIAEPGWLDALVAYAEHHEEAAVVGSKLVFPDDTIQHAGVIVGQDGFPRHIYAGFPADHPVVNKSRRFQVVTAASMLVHRSDFDELGGFDTAFRNGYEDVDFCLRLGERGREVHYCHESVVRHFESASRTVPENGRLSQSDIKHNTKLYVDRWADSVERDDLRYYIEDGLLRVGYSELYPLELAISPALAVVRDRDRDSEADRLLRRRSQQMFELLRDTIRLNVRVAEAELEAESGKENGHAVAHRTAPATPNVVSRGEVHWLSAQPSDRLVSVIMPVKNGAGSLREVLPRVLEQDSRDSLEIVAVDSGSEDDTVDVLREFGAKVVAIEPAAFNHGLTRNLGASFANGDVLVFLNQGALPRDRNWLANLVKALDSDPLVAGVCSRVVPRDDADLLARRDGLIDPSASADREVRTLGNRRDLERLNAHELRLRLNFHTVSAAIRREVFARIRFREVLMGEDVQWAKEILEAGLKIQHEPTSVVVHSHAYSHVEVLRRNVDDGLANRDLVGRRLREADVVPTIEALVRDDWRYLEDECRLAPAELERWRVESALRRSAQIVGQWLGVNRERLSDELFTFVSMTEQTRTRSTGDPRAKALR